MITKDNFKDVCRNISDKDKKRIKTAFKNDSFGFVYLHSHIFNTGVIISAILTNNEYKHITEGATFLPIDEVIENI